MASPVHRITLSFVTCPALPYFSTLSHKRYDFRETSYWTWTVCFDFLYKSVWNIFHSTKNSASYYHTYISVFMWSSRYSCQSLMKLEFSRQIFEIFSNTKFHKNPSSGRRGVPCRQAGRQAGRKTDGQVDGEIDMTKVIATTCNFAKTTKEEKNIAFGDYAINSIFLNPMSLRVVSKKNT